MRYIPSACFKLTNCSLVTYTVPIAPVGIGGHIDAFQYFQRPMTGDLSVEMFIESFSGDADQRFMKGGLMIRESLDAGARHFSIFMMSNGEPTIQQRRSETDGSSEHNYHSSSSSMNDRQLHIRITKQGNTFKS